jgi:hypothetical protein
MGQLVNQSQSMSDQVIQAHQELASLKMAILEMHRDIKGGQVHLDSHK